MSLLSRTFNNMKNIAAPAVVAASVLATPAAMAAGPAITLDHPALSRPEEGAAGLEHVDRLLVLAIDISLSVENDEYRAMMQGFADALTSKDVLQQLQYGMSFAVVTSFFCVSAQNGQMAIIRTEEDAIEFAERALWNSTTNRPYYISTCGSTNINAGLTHARDIISAEAELGIVSTERSIIVAGDGIPSEKLPGLSSLYRLMTSLAQEHKAVVYGVPVTMHEDPKEDVVGFYAQFVTPPGLSYDTGEGYDYPLKQGKVTPAYGFRDIGRATRETLMMGMY